MKLQYSRILDVICENKNPWTADLRFYIQAGLLTLFFAAFLVPVSRGLHEKQLPYTVTASLRILTVFPFHSPAGKHLYATNTLQYFVSRCPHCSNDCRACQPGESALEVLPYHCLSDHRTGCGTARCTPSKRESIQNDRKVVSPLVAARLLLLCSPYHMNSDRPIRRACRFI